MLPRLSYFWVYVVISPLSVVSNSKHSAGRGTTLTGTFPSVENLRGSTISVQRYRGDDLTLIDTPGIFRQSDTETTRLAMEALGDSASVLLVVKATHLDEDLSHMLPLVVGKQGAIAVTFWDKVQPKTKQLKTYNFTFLDIKF